MELSSASWVIDVGANHGDFAQAASTVFPDAKVLLIEPLPSLQPELRERCAKSNSRWFLEPCAAGASAGTAALTIDAGNDTVASLTGFSEEYSRINPSVAMPTGITCSVKTLTQILAKRQIQTVDLLKVDVEGFEFEVLKGTAEILSVVRSIIVEVSLIRRAKVELHPLTAMIGYLTCNGFEIVRVIPSLHAPKQPWHPVEFNILARRCE